MGPKKKEKKGKKKKEEKPPKTTKSEYLKKIADRNAVLAEARRKIKNVEDVYFAAEKKYQQVQEDMADILKYLQHEIEENEEEIAEFDVKILEYKTEITKNDKYYESIFTKMEAEYEEKNTALQYQIQLITAKLFASEEVRQQREEFLRKKEELLRKKQEMEARHEQEIYNAEKSAIIKQDKMQKDMETHLTTLANDFSQATDLAIGETTNKLIRDNINLGNLLTCMQEIIEKARDAYHKMHNAEKNYRYNAELLDEELFIVMRRYLKRSNNIEALLKYYEELKERIEASQKLVKENRRLQRQIAEKECILKDKSKKLEDLLKVLQEHEEAADAVRNTFNALRKIVVQLELCLYEAAKKVKEGIEIENITKLADQDEMQIEMEKEELEENLKEFKYKKRETLIEDVVEKLSHKLHSDPDIQLVVPSTESHMTSFQGSVTSSIEPSSKV